jgi:uncharacterized protein (TIGR03067 family)
LWFVCPVAAAVGIPQVWGRRQLGGRPSPDKPTGVAMRPFLLGLMVAVAVTAIGVASARVGRDDQEPVTDQHKILGEWEVVEQEGAEGILPTTRAGERAATFRFGKDRFSMSAGGQPAAAWQNVGYVLRPTTTPKGIDLYATGDSGEMLTARGLYSLDGDTLVISFGGWRESTRPASLEARPTGKQQVWRLKRVTK